MTFTSQHPNYHDVDYHGYRMRAPVDGSKTITQRVIDWFVTHPGLEATGDEMAADIGEGVKGRQIVAVMSRLRGANWPVHTAGRGRYFYDPTLPPMAGRGSQPGRQTEALKPITDQIDDDAFKAVGLRPVAQTADGDRICVDDQGTAWRVKVTVEATLL